MPECELHSTCGYFERAGGAVAETLKIVYCSKNFIACARYRVATTVGRDHVPADLLPNMHVRAREIISDVGFE